MNLRIHPNRPAGRHTEADAANARSNPVAAFRALLLRMGRPVVGTDKDRKVRREPGSAGGPARSGAGSHLDAETDDAVEASAWSGGGGGGQEGDEGHASLGEGGAGEGILKGPSFISALERATGADEGRDPDSISLSRPSLPSIWPVAALHGSWKRPDPPPSPYAPPADPAQAGPVPAAFRRWARVASIQPYALPPSAATPAARSRYLPSLRQKLFVPIVFIDVSRLSVYSFLARCLERARTLATVDDHECVCLRFSVAWTPGVRLNRHLSGSSRTMSQDEIGKTKTEAPHKHFESAHHVVQDPELSKEQKLQALDHLEQDARQLAIASSEGMSGGEGTGLQEVLAAKEALELPPLAHAYAVVLQDLRSRQKASESDLLRNLIGQAISAFEAIQIVESEREG